MIKLSELLQALGVGNCAAYSVRHPACADDLLHESLNLLSIDCLRYLVNFFNESWNMSCTQALSNGDFQALSYFIVQMVTRTHDDE